MHHHRIDRGLLEQHDVAGKILRGLLVAHGMAAILDDDGFLVILLHVRQRFGQDAGLVERGDVGHVTVSLAGRSVRVLSDWGRRRKEGLACCGVARCPVARMERSVIRESYRRHRPRITLPSIRATDQRLATTAASVTASQLKIIIVPPVGAAIGNSECPAYCRKVRSPANSAAPLTNPN